MKACKNTNKKAGKIHSLESFGTLEGPGIRYVVFLQGCLARCLYCQNPDTWDMGSGSLMIPKDVFKKIESCHPYISSSGGGVTISGGEPLLQVDFLIGLFKLCKQGGIHTAIDTSAFYRTNAVSSKKMDTLIKLTDLFIMDIKAADIKLHKKITSRNLKEVLSFLSMLEKKKRPYWVRYVLVPGLNDSIQDIQKLKELVLGLKYMEKIEFLPYHALGRHKWKHLGLKYPIPGVPAATSEDLKRARERLEIRA